MFFLSRPDSAGKDDYWQQHWVHDLLAALSKVLNICVSAGFPCQAGFPFSYLQSYQSIIMIDLIVID